MNTSSITNALNTHRCEETLQKVLVTAVKGSSSRAHFTRPVGGVMPSLPGTDSADDADGAYRTDGEGEEKMAHSPKGSPRRSLSRRPLEAPRRQPLPLRGPHIFGNASALEVRARQKLNSPSAAAELAAELAESLNSYRESDVHCNIADFDISQNQLSHDDFETLFSTIGASGVRIQRYRLFGCSTLDNEVMEILGNLLTSVTSETAPHELHLSDCAIQTLGFQLLMDAIEANDAFPSIFGPPKAQRATPLYLRLENNYIDEAAIQEKVDAGIISIFQQRAGSMRGRDVPLADAPKVQLLVRRIGGGFQQRTGDPPPPGEAPPPKVVHDKVSAQEEQGMMNSVPHRSKLATSFARASMMRYAGARATGTEKNTRPALRAPLRPPRVKRSTSPRRPVRLTARRAPQSSPARATRLTRPGLATRRAASKSPARASRLTGTRLATRRATSKSPARRRTPERSRSRRRPPLRERSPRRDGHALSKNYDCSRRSPRRAMRGSVREVDRPGTTRLPDRMADTAVANSRSRPAVIGAISGDSSIVRPTIAPRLANGRSTEFNGRRVEQRRSRSPRRMTTTRRTTTAPQKLPPDWEEHMDPTFGIIYYWNLRTLKSQWERPTH